MSSYEGEKERLDKERKRFRIKSEGVRDKERGG